VNDTPLFWNLARASGFIAYALIAGTMLLGLSVKTRALKRFVKPASVVDIHRVLSLLALAMIALHGTALVLDSVVEISPLDLLVPGIVDYRPVWVAFGIVAAWLALAIHASFSLRKKIGSKNWRRLHWLTYAVFFFGTVHGIASGTDSGEPWALAIYGLLVGAVVGGTVWRVMGAKAAAAAKEAGASGPAFPAAARRLGPAALLSVAFVGVAAAGVLANVTLLDAARPPDVPVGSLGPLAPPEKTAKPAVSRTTLTRTTSAAAPKPMRPRSTPRPTPKPAPAPTRTHDDRGEIEGAEDDD
jgi:methionine sulfoxide reductase heme-binding subunit